MDNKLLDIFPLTTTINAAGHLCIGGCDCINLVNRYGSPLYLFDEVTIRARCKEFTAEFRNRYKNTIIAYASKAFLNRSLAQILKDEGMALDVVSGGELSVAQAIEFPPEEIFFHGNNKSEMELLMAIEGKVGRIVVDNFYELDLLNKLAEERRSKVNILLRLNPGIDPHTHRYTTTGILDSKFGFPIGTGQAEIAVKHALSLKYVSLLGLHFHLGSPITDTEPYRLGIEVALKFASAMQSRYSFELKEFSSGGGFAVKYTSSTEIPSVASYAEVITNSLSSLTSNLRLGKPRLIVEPGRGIIAQAGVALYKVGSIKNIPNVRTYVCVNGGMGDNIRPALYEAKYEAVLADKVNAPLVTDVTIAGRYCEAGDILIKDIKMPELSPGNIIAVPVCGAYCIPMSSNYNMVPHPAVIMVKDKKSRIIRRRQKYTDLLRLDAKS